MMSDRVRGLSVVDDGGWVKIAIVESGLGSDLEIWVQEKILDDPRDICS